MISPPPSASGASFRLAERGGEKERETLPESRKVFEVTVARTSGLVNIVLSRQTIVKLFFFLFFKCEHPLTKSAVPSARLLGLGSKLYPSKIQRMLNNDSSRDCLEYSASRMGFLTILRLSPRKSIILEDFIYRGSSSNKREM